MNFFIVFTSITVAILALAILSNQARSRHQVSFELKPNCLLTRWPLVFVTGPRSLFYFSTYWNLYTVFLAEHGYEVFTLHLPWSNPQDRKARFEEFLKNQEIAQKHFHFFMDAPTFAEFRDLLKERRSDVVRSLNEVIDANTGDAQLKTELSALPFPTGVIECQSTLVPYWSLKWTYFLHRLVRHNPSLPALSTLGVTNGEDLQNCIRLLERTQTLAEMDLREDP